LAVKFDGKELGKITGVTPVMDAHPYSVRTLTFVPASAGGLLEFITTAQGDATVLLDAVSIVRRDPNDVILINSSFEASGNPVGVGYLQPKKMSGWSQTGAYGVNITGLGPFTDNGIASDQDRVLLMQGPGTLAQTVTDLTPNQKYTLVYSYNARNCCGGGATRYSVSFADVPLVEDEEVSPVGVGEAFHLKTLSFTPSVAEGELKFTTSPEGDHTFLLDDIRLIKGVFEPPVALRVSIAGGNLKLSWPVGASGFKLESTLALPGGWAADSASITVEGTDHVATVAAGAKSKFYRLRK